MQCPLQAGERSGEAYRQANEAILASGAGLPVVSDPAFREHLENCACCKAAVQSQREVWEALDAWTPAPVPERFDERVYARIDAYEKQSWWQRTVQNLAGAWSWRPAVPVAVACTVLIAAFVLENPDPQHVPETRVQHVSRNQVGMNYGSDNVVDVQQVERALDDLDMLTKLGVALPQPANSQMRSQTL